MSTDRTKKLDSRYPRWKEWVFVGLLAGLAVGLILLPKHLSVWIFAVMVLAVPVSGVAVGVPWLLDWTGGRLRRSVSRWPVADRLQQARRWSRLAVGLAVLAALLTLPGVPPLLVGGGLAVWLGAIISLGAGLWLWPQPLTVLTQSDLTPRATFGQVRWPLLIAAGLALLLLAEINTGRWHYFVDLSASFHVQMVLLVGGCAGVIAAFGGVRRPASLTRRDLWLLVALTLLAFALNTWQLATAVHTFIDEFHSVHAVDRLVQNPDYRILRPFDGVPAFTAVYTYLQMVSLTIFGPNLAGLRLASVALGTLVVPAVNLLGRELFDRKTALLAALLLATFPPFLHFSRMGINNIADPLLGVLALAFLVRGLKYGHLGDYAFSGVMLGLTQYFYEGGKLLYPPLILGWLALVVWLWRPWGQWRGLLTLIGVFVLVALPTFYLARLGEVTLTPRLDVMNTFRGYFDPLTRGSLGAFFGERYLPHLLHFFNMPDKSGFFYSTQVGLVLTHLVPFFMLGVGVALARLRLAGVLLIAWLAATIFGNSLVWYNTSTPRFVIAFPLVALLLAVGIRHVLPLILPEKLPEWWSQPRWRVALVAVGIMYIALPSVIFYFGPNMVVYNQLLRSINKDIGDVMYRLRDLPPDTQIYIFHQDDQFLYEQRITDYEVWWGDLPDFHMERVNDDSSDLLMGLPLQTNLAVFLDPEDSASIAVLRERFGTIPQPQYSPYSSVPRDRQYVLFLIEADGLGRGPLLAGQDEN